MPAPAAVGLANLVHAAAPTDVVRVPERFDLEPIPDAEEPSALDLFGMISERMMGALTLAWEDDCLELFTKLGQFDIVRWAKRTARRIRMARKRRRGYA